MEQQKSDDIFFQKAKISKWTERRFSPCNFLESVIQEYMIIESTERTVLETLPSNLFSLNYILRGSVQLSQVDGTQIDLPKAVSFGITQRFFHFTFSDFAKLFVIVIKPGHASIIIDKPLNEFFEKFIPINELFDESTNMSLLESLKELSSDVEIINKVELFLIDKIVQKNFEEHVHNSISKIHQRRGSITIKEILEDLPVSRDTFEKKFRKQVGTTPKKYANIVRIKKILERTAADDKLTQIALDAGYYDQSHFIKDFKFYTGKLPSDCF